ncbi:PilW family protein [Variovorax sp. J22R133]|uniref:PilW family protein n=1 Tax=Variovorax brevis TaxID=3053503 RepID=UPI002576CD85|nr:PilW family protein [Variovorax sp. J22R133]MDM0115279.1 PilW family protein [Variovorax sp. J22R133]
MKTKLPRRQRGVTLIELLISIAIGLLLAAAASYLFLSTHRISQVLDAKSQQQETASIVLDIIGRDLKNAGFYPAGFPTTTASAKFQGAYSNAVSAAVPAFDQGVFGCVGGIFNVTTGTCPTPDANEPDSLVINYFSSDTFSVKGVGTRQDCLGQNVELAAFSGTTYNAARAGAGSAGVGTVSLPLFISNAYGLGASYTYLQGGQSIQTRSFRCAGNGPNANPYQPLLPGISQLRFRYGVASATSMEAPERFYTATEVSAMAAIDINGQPRTGWQRVSAVQVCVLAKTLDPSVRQTTTGSYIDCDGVPVNYSATDRAIYQQRTRVFGVRNNLTQTF